MVGPAARHPSERLCCLRKHHCRRKALEDTEWIHLGHGIGGRRRTSGVGSCRQMALDRRKGRVCPAMQ